LVNLVVGQFGSWSILGEYKEGVKLIDVGPHKTIYNIGNVDGVNKDSELYKGGLFIYKLIRKAAKALDKYLSNLLKTSLEIDDYYLNNVFYKLNSIYRYFKYKLRDELEEHNDFRKNYEEKKQYFVNKYELDYIRRIEYDGGKVDLEFWKSVEESTVINYNRAFINEVIEKSISNLTFSLITSFFSVLDFILNAFYVFDQTSENFSLFRDLRWKSKFKKTFSINSDKLLKDFYDELSRIKGIYRNPLTHGLIKETDYLVFLPSIGLIPFSFSDLNKTTLFRYIEIDSDESIRIIKIFEDFFDFLSITEPFNYYMAYFKYNFPIPINQDEINKIKEEMTSIESFEQYLIDRAEYEDRIINMDF